MVLETEDDQPMRLRKGEASTKTIPSGMRNLRACLLCSLVKTVDQFIDDGCDNCEQVLALKRDSEKVIQCTSTNYDGIICMMQPSTSWVAKWQNIQRKVPGVYAVSVTGTLPPDVIAELRHVGVHYRPGQRDRNQKR